MKDERRFGLRGFLRGYWRIGLALGAVLGLLNFTYFIWTTSPAASTRRSSSRLSRR